MGGTCGMGQMDGWMEWMGRGQDGWDEKGGWDFWDGMDGWMAWMDGWVGRGQNGWEGGRMGGMRMLGWGEVCELDGMGMKRSGWEHWVNWYGMGGIS